MGTVESVVAQLAIALPQVDALSAIYRSRQIAWITCAFINICKQFQLRYTYIFIYILCYKYLLFETDVSVF